MKNNRFNRCRSLEDLKKEYKRECLKWHPDLNPDNQEAATEEMKAINNEYAEMFEILKRNQNKRAETDHTSRHTDEMPQDYIQVINLLITLDGIEIELCGRWLWISGETKKHKDTLKAVGCRWCSKKKCWSWHPNEAHTVSRGNYTMDSIRAKYGTERIITGSAAASRV